MFPAFSFFVQKPKDRRGLTDQFKHPSFSRFFLQKPKRRHGWTNSNILPFSVYVPYFFSRNRRIGMAAWRTSGEDPSSGRERSCRASSGQPSASCTTESSCCRRRSWGRAMSAPLTTPSCYSPRPGAVVIFVFHDCNAFGFIFLEYHTFPG